MISRTKAYPTTQRKSSCSGTSTPAAISNMKTTLDPVTIEAMTGRSTSIKNIKNTGTKTTVIAKNAKAALPKNPRVLAEV